MILCHMEDSSRTHLNFVLVDAFHCKRVADCDDWAESVISRKLSVQDAQASNKRDETDLDERQNLILGVCL